MERILYSVPEALEQLGGIGRATFYQLVKAGQLSAVKLGRRTFVTDDEIRRFVGRLAENGREREVA